MLAAIGLSKREAREVVRMSFAARTQRDDVDTAADAMIDEIEALLAASVSGGARRQRV